MPENKENDFTLDIPIILTMTLNSDKCYDSGIFI